MRPLFLILNKIKDAISNDLEAIVVSQKDWTHVITNAAWLLKNVHENVSFQLHPKFTLIIACGQKVLALVVF